MLGLDAPDLRPHAPPEVELPLGDEVDPFPMDGPSHFPQAPPPMPPMPQPPRMPVMPGEDSPGLTR